VTILYCARPVYRDSTSQVQVHGGKTAVCNFSLTPDSTLGTVLGEFQDVTIVRGEPKNDSSIASWDP